MTEFEAAAEFVRDYAAVPVPVRRDLRLDEPSAFRWFCGIHGIEPHAERLQLARDVVIAALEYLARPESDDAESDEPEDIDEVPALDLIALLECHGWRIDFLNQPVRP